MSPVQGFTRLRAHQFGRQSVAGTVVAATRRYPLQGVPAHDLQWTDSEVDVGSIVTVVPPVRGIPQLTAPLNVPQLDYNTMTLLWAGVLGGNEAPTPSGTSQGWAWAPAATSPLDPYDRFTYEFGDDVTTDWFQYGDGYLESFTLTGPEGLGACTATTAWRFGSIASTGSTDSPVTGTVPTPDLTVDKAPPIMYLKDMGIYIASSSAGLSGGQIMDALHTFTLTVAQTTDEKRFANATQTFDVSDLGRTGYTLELEATFAKTSDTVGTGSESDAWMSDEAVDRYMELKWTSTRMASTGPDVPFSQDIVFPARYYTRTEGEVGGNTTVVLNAHAFLDEEDLEAWLTVALVNQLAEADLGAI